MSKKINRRDFLRFGAVTAGGVIVAACTPAQPAPTTAPIAAPTTAPAAAAPTATPAPPAAAPTATAVPPTPVPPTAVPVASVKDRLTKIGWLPGAPTHAKGWETILPETSTPPNAGRSWQAVDLPVGYEAVISLALSPYFAEDGTLLAGTETRGLLCSQDRGAHWRSLGQPVLSNAIDQILLSPDYPREPRLLVLHDGALFVSDDAGAVWKRWYEPSLENEAATAVLAPRGLGTDASLWLGLEDGQTIRIQV